MISLTAGFCKTRPFPPNRGPLGRQRFSRLGVRLGVTLRDNIVSFGSERESQLLRKPPSNLDAEKGLLGAIMMSDTAFERVSTFLRPEHFSDLVHERIYTAISRLRERGQQANPITLKTYLETDDLLAQVGGMKYIAALANSVVTVVNVAEYGKLIHDLFLRRELINLGETLVNEAFEDSLDSTAPELIEAATGRLTDLMGQQSDHAAISIGDAVAATMKRWERHDRGEIGGISTGLSALDREMGLLEDGDLIVLAARPAMGKTALSCTIALHASKLFVATAGNAKPKRALVFTAEMSHEELASRAMTTETGIQGPRRRSEALDTFNWAKLLKFKDEIAKLPLVLDDRGAPSLGYVRARCRQEQRKGAIGLIVVDYLQIMGADRGKRYDGRTDEVSHLVRGLKEIARVIRCPLIVLSQLNRGVENRDNKRPTLSDLRDSGEIEAAADIVAFCFREEYYLEQQNPKEGKETDLWEMNMTNARGQAEIIIAKHRHGGTGTAKLKFDKARTLFSDIEHVSDSLPLSAYEQDGRLF